jgi:surface antigen
MMTKKISLILFFSATVVLVGCVGPGPKLARDNLCTVCAPYDTTCSTQLVCKDSTQLLGSLISGYTQQKLDQSDEKMARDTASRALDVAPDGSSQYWRNPNTDMSGESTAIETTTKNGSLCRVLKSVAYDDFDMELGHENVQYCRIGDKKWTPAG